MAATTLTSIIDAWQLVLAADPLSLTPSQQAFSHDRQPNASIQNSYWIEDGGQQGRRPVTNNHEVRLDRLRIFVAKPLAFAGVAQFEAMLTLGDQIYRYLSADGRTNGWNVEQSGHRVTQPKKTDLLIGSFDFTVDYDFNAGTS